MEIISLLYNKVHALILLLILSHPYKIIQKPIDFSSLNLLQTTDTASTDFGRIQFNPPASILKPKTPNDISHLLSFLSVSSFSHVPVSARGAGHSIHGQAQALDGIVVEMSSLPPGVKVHRNERTDNTNRGFSYVDVSGGALWIEVLKDSMKFGLAPRSWTDYLYLTIGGTLSNGGISGQTFKYGPQIANVLELDVVTGKKICVLLYVHAWKVGLKIKIIKGKNLDLYFFLFLGRTIYDFKENFYYRV